MAERPMIVGEMPQRVAEQVKRSYCLTEANKKAFDEFSKIERMTIQ